MMIVSHLFAAAFSLKLFLPTAMDISGEKPDPSTCYEVVAYQPSRILPMFDQHTRSFDIAGKEWVIQQRWDDIGVASVVWEPVGLAVWLVCVCSYVYPLPNTLVRPCCWLSTLWCLHHRSLLVPESLS